LRNVWGPIEAVTDTRGFDFSKNLPFDVTASSLDWLRHNGHGPDPFFLFVHYDGPHTPFRLPDEHAHPFDSVPPDQVDPAVETLMFPRAERLDDDRNKTSMYRFMKDVNWGRRKLDGPTLQWIIDKYDAAVRYNDLAIGELLEGLREQGLADDTVVAVLSDHGEEFLEHGGFAHGGIHLYEEIIRTVGIIHDPSRPGTGAANPRPCSQVDMLGSLLHLAGAEGLDPGIDGLALHDSSRPSGPVFCHGKSKLAVRDGAHKMIVPRPNPALDAVTRLKMWINMLRQGKLRPEIFDLEQDPGETRNLAGDRDLRKRMQGLLAAHLASRPREILADTRIDDAERRRIEQEMKDLGYM
ncbi:MAG: sulfatase-like hydrolase/transferase, partial [bacterium]